jgi:cyclophilin family peptidyl-prolyl cis-trans isomerase
LLSVVAVLVAQTTQPAPLPTVPFEHVKPELRTPRTTVNAGQPVWIEFVLRNTSDQPVEISVPGAVPSAVAASAMGLPIEHVFSGASWQALAISDGVRRRLGDNVRRPPDNAAPVVRLAAHCSVGITLDAARWYPTLRQPGRYALTWRPYGGLIKSDPLVVRIEMLKQVVVQTDLGQMAIQLLYDEAPQHVANFLDLAGQGFYNGTTFWRVVRGALIQGGDPKGDGTGLRPDGRTLEPEFNNTPFEAGTIGMALTPGDPDSGSCQFFVCLRRMQVFDGQFTAFAQVVGDDSFETLARIGSVQTDQADRPTQPVTIQSMSVRPMSVRQED